jgi:ABC-type histidine transport system ATPase subunit
MIIVTHEMRFALDVSNTCHFFANGRVIESGQTDVILRQPESDRLQQFLSTIQQHI